MGSLRTANRRARRAMVRDRTMASRPGPEPIVRGECVAKPTVPPDGPETVGPLPVLDNPQPASGPLAEPPRERHARLASVPPVAMVLDDPETDDPETDGIGAATAAILGRAPSQCRWPIGDPRSPDFRFCGATAERGKPYCREHMARAYIGAPRMDDDKVEWLARLAA